MHPQRNCSTPARGCNLKKGEKHRSCLKNSPRRRKREPRSDRSTVTSSSCKQSFPGRRGGAWARLGTLLCSCPGGSCGHPEHFVYGNAQREQARTPLHGSQPLIFTLLPCIDPISSFHIQIFGPLSSFVITWTKFHMRNTIVMSAPRYSEMKALATLGRAHGRG